MGELSLRDTAIHSISTYSQSLLRQTRDQEAQIKQLKSKLDVLNKKYQESRIENEALEKIIEDILNPIPLQPEHITNQNIVNVNQNNRVKTPVENEDTSNYSYVDLRLRLHAIHDVRL